MNRFWIWFNLLNIDNNKKIEILRKYDVSHLYMINKEILKEFRLSNLEIKEFFNSQYYSISNKIVKYNSRNKINLLTILDNDYPFLLKQIYNPPILLYYKGKRELLNQKSISIFSGKDMDVYGRKVLKQITNNLLKDKICLVTKFEEYDKSLFFRNINNENILVLSSGIKENTYSKNGVVISENEPYINSDRNQIIKRNRIITGLTYESIFIQMTLQDGAGYIVDNLLEQNRELWVVPGDITKYQNFYTNELIKHGVNVLTHYNNLLVYEHRKNDKNMLTANKCHLNVTKV